MTDQDIFDHRESNVLHSYVHTRVNSGKVKITVYMIEVAMRMNNREL